MSDQKISCALCNALVHSIKIHLRDDHPDMSVEQYQQVYPDAPLLSEAAIKKIEEVKARKAAEAAGMVTAEHMAAVVTLHTPDTVVPAPLHEVFKLGAVPAALSGRGKPIMVSTVPATASPDMLLDVDANYVFDIGLLKDAMMAIEMPTPLYLWGHKGTGKTTLAEQICAHTGRPAIRVQHTINTEECHIVGMMQARNGETVWEDGPLPLAMRNGWTYIADEYDFGLAHVLGVYQAVLEGKSLVIKEAPASHRVVKPHPNFRFIGTGNTNGSGDDTGLYQGTNIQNSANYDRFGIVIQVHYMPKAQEVQILMNQARLPKEYAEKMVDFANLVREAFDGQKISETISTRVLITASKIGIKRGDWLAGLALSFMNKLNKLDREVVNGLAQRVFG